MNALVTEHEDSQAEPIEPPRADGVVPLVGLGGSAGSIDALKDFFRSMPRSGRMAFVVVIHLDPEHESSLAQLLQRCSAMRVLQVRDRVHVEPDTVYVIPPGKAIRTTGNDLVLGELGSDRGRHVAIDLFLRTLADSHGPHGAAVILSGMDGDGAIGIKRIKERGGLTIAQDPAEAPHDSMPRAAIATGLVDWVLPVQDMPQRLNDYFGMESALRLPPEEEPHAPQEARGAGLQYSDEAALREVLSLLRTRTGRDFGKYKRATLLRRIARRMQVNATTDLRAYLDCLRTRNGEAQQLLQELLISVTNFFRDPECFAALETHFNALFRGKGPSDTLRVWVVGCATGEEAYTLAMLLSEKARQMESPPLIQVFASDLDEPAIRIAREGLYPASIEADVSAERLRRCFVREHRGYRIRREIREMVLFAQHDILHDSPFSRIDLISCRNLLIYLNRDAQRRVFETFHFALRPQGMLFLGSSESAEDAAALFGVLDKKHRIFVQRPMQRTGLPVPSGVGSLALAQHAQQARSTEGPVVAGRVFSPPPPLAPAAREPQARSGSWGELHFKLLEALAAPSVLVDAQHDILHLSPHAGRFLQFAGGEPSRNLLHAIHPGLRIELRAALSQAAQTRSPADVVATVQLEREAVPVRLRVVPVTDEGAELFLVTLSPQPQEGEQQAPATAATSGEHDPVVRQLDREIERLKGQLRDTVEQYEASTEELKASNEELQAMNEELRSATEELETSREELQSINEELSTVNQELKSKIDELGYANSDMHNLMDATAIATVFLDRDLCVMRYTPSAVRLFSLIPTDLGRPLADLATRLDYPQLGVDARAVLERLVPIEREVGLSEGKWFLARLLPYGTLDDHIGGVVLSFVDITERKRAEEVRLWLSAVVAQSTDAIVSFSMDSTILSWNRGAEAIFGWTAEEAIGQPLDALWPRDPASGSPEIMTVLGEGKPVSGLELERARKDGGLVRVEVSISPICDATDNRVIGGTAIARDITQARQAAEALRSSEERLRMIIENAQDYAIFSMDLERRITSWNSGAQRLLGYSAAEAVGRSGDLIFTEEDRSAGAPQREARTALESGRAGDDRYHQRKDGSRFWASGACMLMRNTAGEVVGFVKILRDQTAVLEAQQALQRSQRELVNALADNQQARTELEKADEAKDRFLAVLSHELRNPLASIGSAAELLVRPGIAPATVLKAAKVVQRQVAGMKAQLDDLLDISRLRLGHGLALRRRTVTLASVIDAAVEATRHLLDAAGHQLEVQQPPGPVEVDVDPVRISQVLANLLTNAARYTPEPGRIQLRAEVREGGWLHLAVEDNGIGMDPDDIERMFELFAQAAEPGRGPGGGLGIGLALARSIVQMHGGRIGASSRGLGRGACVSVDLPVVVSAPAADAAAQAGADAAVATAAQAETDAGADPDGLAAPAESGAGEPAAESALVLVADDNQDAAWGLSELLQLHGYRTLVAGGGNEALDLAQQHRPAAMLVDLGMPDLSGIEVARRIRAQDWGRSVVLVAATGWGQDSDVRSSREAGFDLHLTKPLDIDDAVRRIAGLLAERALP